MNGPNPYTDLKHRAVLVTGADGFIGSHLVEGLVRAGAKVTALALYNAFDQHGWLDDLPPETRAAITISRGDVRDAHFTRKLVAGQELVFHLAALIGIPHSYDAPQSYVDVNITGTLNMLEAARAAGVARFVHTSTSEVYGTALVEPITEAHPLQGQSPYAASKIGADHMVEAYVRSFGLPAVILRPFNTFGPRQSERAVIPTMIRQMLDPTCVDVRVGDLTPRRDFTFVEDTAEAFLAIASAKDIEFGTAYNGGTGIAVTIGETLARLEAITKSGKKVVSEAQRVRPEHSEVRALLADHSRLTQSTGWRARSSLDEGLARTVAWWRARLATGRVRPGAHYAT